VTRDAEISANHADRRFCSDPIDRNLRERGRLDGTTCGVSRVLPRGLGGLGRVPALAVSLDLAVLDEMWHHAIQVIGLGAHRRGDLRNRDSRMFAHERERLIAARPAPSTAGSRAVPRRSRPIHRLYFCGAAGTAARQRRSCRLQLRHLGVEIFKATVDIGHRPINNSSQARHLQISAHR
jgi:hypothetical protein